MNELDLLRNFFQAWESLHALPVQKGAPSLEKKAATQHLQECADAVRNAPKAMAVIDANAKAQIPPEASEYRQLQSQIAALPPQIGKRVT